MRIEFGLARSHLMRIESIHFQRWIGTAFKPDRVIIQSEHAEVMWCIRRRGNVEVTRSCVFLQYVVKTEIINEEDTQRHGLNVATMESRRGSTWQYVHAPSCIGLIRLSDC